MAEHARGTFAVTLTPDAGISGRLELEIRDGQHHYDLVHDLPDA